MRRPVSDLIYIYIYIYIKKTRIKESNNKLQHSVE